ncbi:MAG: hypothetical protein ACI4TW_03565 [Prevotella sp.]
MKKYFLALVLCLISLGMIMPTEANAQKKKKEFKWTLPELTGNANFDEYLLKCDTLYNNIQNYCNNIVFYDVAEITVIDENGEKDIKYQVVDKDGNLRSSNKAFQQNMNLIMAYPDIALDMTNMALYTTSATAALPGLGMKSLSYGKYLKAGPNIISLGGDEMKKIYKKARAQAKQIKALKQGKIDEVKALQAEVDGGDVNAGTASLRAIEMNKANYEEQFGKIEMEDNQVGDVTSADIPEEAI